MKQLLSIIFFLIILLAQNVYAQNYSENYNQYQKRTFKEQKEIDSMLNERLNLTQEQVEYINTDIIVG